MPGTMHILDLISPETTKVPLEARDKTGAIGELVELLHAAGRIDDPKEILRIVLEREQQRSTGIGDGLAIPHGRCESLSDIVVAIGLPAEPLDFDAFDKKPVRLVILLLSPPDRTGDHIQALGRISRMLADRTVREKVFGASSTEALLATLRDDA